MFWSFQSNKRQKMSGTPELDYFMNKEESDVVFVVEGKRIPALKTLLSVKSTVFCAMFSGHFREAKDKEVVIEDTTYEAFKAFIQFLYCDHLVLIDNDLKLFRELYRLSDRYDVSLFQHKITDELIKANSHLFNGSKCVSDESFQKDWKKMQSIGRIGFEFKIQSLESNALAFIGRNLDHFLKRSLQELIELSADSLI